MSSLNKTSVCGTQPRQERKRKARLGLPCTAGAVVACIRLLFLLLLTCQFPATVESAVVLIERTTWLRTNASTLYDVEWSLDLTTRQEQEKAVQVWRATVFLEDSRLSPWRPDNNITCANDIQSMTKSIAALPSTSEEEDLFCSTVAVVGLWGAFRLEPLEPFIMGGYRFRFAWEERDKGHGPGEDGKGEPKSSSLWGYADFAVPSATMANEEQIMHASEYGRSMVSCSPLNAYLPTHLYLAGQTT